MERWEREMGEKGIEGEGGRGREGKVEREGKAERRKRREEEFREAKMETSALGTYRGKP